MVAYNARVYPARWNCQSNEFRHLIAVDLSQSAGVGGGLKVQRLAGRKCRAVLEVKARESGGNPLALELTGFVSELDGAIRQAIDELLKRMVL